MPWLDETEALRRRPDSVYYLPTYVEHDVISLCSARDTLRLHGLGLSNLICPQAGGIHKRGALMDL